MKKNSAFTGINSLILLTNFGLNIAMTFTLHKQARKNLKMTVGTNLALSALAVVVSWVQTKRLINNIRKESNEGSDLIANAMSLSGFTHTQDRTKV